MATLKQRLHRKNSSGTYDTIHLETGADCITGTLAIANGGTGATTAANARTNLGAAASSHTHTIGQVTSLQSEINSLKTSVSSGKAAIASAVTGKGVQTAADASFQTMANNINAIPTGSPALTVDDSDEFYNSDDYVGNYPYPQGSAPWFTIVTPFHADQYLVQFQVPVETVFAKIWIYTLDSNSREGAIISFANNTVLTTVQSSTNLTVTNGHPYAQFTRNSGFMFLHRFNSSFVFGQTFTMTWINFSMSENVLNIQVDVNKNPQNFFCIDSLTLTKGFKLFCYR